MIRWKLALALLAALIGSSAFAADPRDASRYRNLQVGDGGYFGPYHHYPVSPPVRTFDSRLGVGLGSSYIGGLGTGYVIPKSDDLLPTDSSSSRLRRRSR